MEKIVLKRKIYDKIREWKEKYAPEYALFLKGARRVGKTTIAEEFGKKEYRSYITVSFQSANDTVKDLFVNSLLDLDYLFNVLQMQYKTKLYPHESLVILDEIQLYPLARQALKTLLINLSFGDGSYMDNEFYKAILTDKLHINEGMFIENIVAQCLRTNGHKIIFYVEYDKLGKMEMEVDFLIRSERKIVPIEAKSGKSYTTKSLTKFKEKYNIKVGKQYVLHEGDIKREGDVYYMPYYTAWLL